MLLYQRLYEHGCDDTQQAPAVKTALGCPSPSRRFAAWLLQSLRRDARRIGVYEIHQCLMRDSGPEQFSPF
jgi:hypothetical protein